MRCHININLGAVAGLVLAGAAAAQPFEIPSYTIDGGGGTSVGGLYSLSGTIGQPDAHPAMAGGAFELSGGFWVEAGGLACNGADLAEPFGVLDLGDITAFVSAFLAQDSLADIDGNGIFDLSDIGLFVSAFLAGCP